MKTSDTKWKKDAQKNKQLLLQCRKPIKRKREEATNQIYFLRWLEIYDRSVWNVTFHIPNGGYRNLLEASFLKKEGVKPGIPDIFCAYPIHPYHGLFIEMKSSKGLVSAVQNEMQLLLSEQGYKVCVCYTAQEAEKAIKAYLAGSYDISPAA